MPQNTNPQTTNIMALDLILTDNEQNRVDACLAKLNDASPGKKHHAVTKMLLSNEPPHLVGICKAIFALGTEFGGMYTGGITSDGMWLIIDSQVQKGELCKTVAKYFYLGAHARRLSEPEAEEYWG